MKKIVIVGDIHLSAPTQDVLNINMHERLDAVIQHINHTQADAEVCIFLGDLSQGGQPESYHLLQEQLDHLTISYGLMIGNHDQREAFRTVFPNSPVDEHGFIQQAIDLGEGFKLLLLDTVNGSVEDKLEKHVGMLCSARLSWLERQLSDAEANHIFIFMHHPPHAVSLPGMDMIRLKNGGEFYELVTQYKQVRHLFCGHVHRSISGTYYDIPFAVAKSLRTQTPLDFASLDPTASTAEPPAYQVALLSDEGTLVHTVEYEFTKTRKSYLKEAMAHYQFNEADLARLQKKML